MESLIAVCRFAQKKESFSLGVESCLGYTDSSRYSEYSQRWELFFWLTPLLVQEELNCTFLDCIFQVEL